MTQSKVLWDLFLFSEVSSECQVFPTALILLLGGTSAGFFYLLCYTFACPTFTQFFSILHFLCPRDTNIISLYPITTITIQSRL